MKTLIILFLCISFNSFSQEYSFIRISGDINLNIYLPYTSKLNETKSPYEINSFISTANVDFGVFKKNKFSFYSGVTYKFTHYLKKDAVGSYSYEDYNGNTKTFTYYKDPADLVAKSHALGISLEGNYLLKSNERYKMELGLRPSVYFLELYNASYQSDDELPQGHSGPQPLITKLPQAFFLSSINTAIIYRITLLPKTGRTTFTGKFSLGANIYSDWEQFKRYVWLGVGLEIGFLGKEK